MVLGSIRDSQELVPPTKVGQPRPMFLSFNRLRVPPRDGHRSGYSEETNVFAACSDRGQAAK